MNEKIRELAENFLDIFVGMPMVGLFYFFVYIEKIYILFQIGYYNLFGIKYIMQSDKFNKYPVRIDE